MCGVGTQGYSGRRVSNTTVALLSLSLFLPVPFLTLSSFPPYVLLPFLPSYRLSPRSQLYSKPALPLGLSPLFILALSVSCCAIFVVSVALLINNYYL